MGLELERELLATGPWQSGTKPGPTSTRQYDALNLKEETGLPLHPKLRALCGHDAHGHSSRCCKTASRLLQNLQATSSSFQPAEEGPGEQSR